MVPFQMWIEGVLRGAPPITRVMQTRWGWPIAESVHFIGLTLLVGTIFLFDLRLLGLARRIPIGALHKLVPWGVGGFLLTAASGMLFLLAEPDQYIYNPAFHWKVVFMMAAGLNAGSFYLVAYRRTASPGAPDEAPRVAKAIAVASLCLWIGVIVAGRLLTFHRPWPCESGTETFIATCVPDND
jgi:hypothetical protein